MTNNACTAKCQQSLFINKSNIETQTWPQFRQSQLRIISDRYGIYPEERLTLPREHEHGGISIIHPINEFSSFRKPAGCYTMPLYESALKNKVIVVSWKFFQQKLPSRPCYLLKIGSLVDGKNLTY